MRGAGWGGQEFEEVIQRWLIDPNDFNPSETEWMQKDAANPVDYEHSIMVDGWQEITPFSGMGKRRTIYEAPEYEQRM